MPNKSRRAASRQAEVRRRRKRGRGAAETFDTGPTESQRVARIVEEEASGQTQTAAPSPTGVACSPRWSGMSSRGAAVARPARITRSAGRDEAPAYGYLGSELRRIGVITTLIVAILIGATFALGG